MHIILCIILFALKYKEISKTKILKQYQQLDRYAVAPSNINGRLVYFKIKSGLKNSDHYYSYIYTYVSIKKNEN